MQFATYHLTHEGNVENVAHLLGLPRIITQQMVSQGECWDEQITSVFSFQLNLLSLGHMSSFYFLRWLRLFSENTCCLVMPPWLYCNHEKNQNTLHVRVNTKNKMKKQVLSSFYKISSYPQLIHKFFPTIPFSHRLSNLQLFLLNSVT